METFIKKTKVFALKTGDWIWWYDTNSCVWPALLLKKHYSSETRDSLTVFCNGQIYTCEAHEAVKIKDVATPPW